MYKRREATERGKKIIFVATFFARTKIFFLIFEWKMLSVENPTQKQKFLFKKTFIQNN